VALESLQARLGLRQNSRRYIDLESVRELEEISNPETTGDESSTGLREWADRHPAAAIFGLIVVVFGGLLLLRYTARFATTLVTNPWTYATIIGIGILGFTFRTGWRKRDQRVTQYDELQLKIGEDATAYKGKWIDLPGKASAFIAIKGWSGLLASPRPYQNGEIAAALDQSFDPRRIEEAGAAVIRLEPGQHGSLLGITDTEWGGKRIVQETGGLEVDPNGNRTSLRCTLPDFGDERANAVAEQLEQVKKDYSDAQAEIDDLERRMRNLRDRMSEPIEDEVERRIEQHQRIAAAAGGSRGRQSPSGVPPVARDDWQGTGSTEVKQNELQEVKDELTDDEE